MGKLSRFALKIFSVRNSCKTIACILVISLIFDFGLIFPAFTNADSLGFSRTDSGSRQAQNLTEGLSDLLIPHMIQNETFKGNSRFQILLFRDLHAQEEAQFAISKAIQYLHQKLDVDHVFIEGAQGALRASLYESFPDEKVRSEVAREFLKEGFLSGSEYAGIHLGIADKIFLFGVEDQKLYLENFKAFRQTRHACEKFERNIGRIDTDISALKKKIFSDDLLEIDAILEEMHHPDLAIDLFMTKAEAFFQHADKKSFPEECLKKWEALKPLRKLIQSASKLDQEKIREELRLLVTSFQEKLVKEDLKKIISAGLKYQLGQIQMFEYLSSLKDVYEKNFTAPHSFSAEYPNLDLWIKLAERQNALHFEEIWNSLKDIFEMLRKNLARHEDQKRLIEFLDRWNLFKKLLHLELSREDLEALHFQKPALLGNVAGFLKEYHIHGGFEKNNISTAVSSAFQFYDLALLRDRVMVRNTLEKLRENNFAQSKVQTSVLVTGGFHTQGIQKILKEEGVSYAVYTPQVNKDLDTALYERRMMDTSYDLEKVDFSVNRQILRKQMKQARGMLSPPVLLSEAFEAIGTPLFQVKLQMLRIMIKRIQNQYESLNQIVSLWMDKIEDLSLAEFELLFEALDSENIFVKLTDLNPENVTQREITLTAVKKAYETKFPSLVKLTEMYFSKRDSEKIDGTLAAMDFKNLARGSLEEILEREDFDPQELINMLKRSSFLKRQFEFGPVVWEGYSLEQHTLRVLGQFEHYWKGRNMPSGIGRAEMRLFLALHDIGKSLAVQKGDKREQHVYSRKIIHKLLADLGYDARLIRFFMVMADGDPLGRFLTGGSIERAIADIQKMAKNADMMPSVFLETLLIYYQADASSYIDDGGKLSPLKYVFEIQREGRFLAFSSLYAPDIENLRMRINEPLPPMDGRRAYDQDMHSARAWALKNGVTENFDSAESPDEIRNMTLLFLARRDGVKAGLKEPDMLGKKFYEIYSMIDEEYDRQAKAVQAAGLILNTFDNYWVHFNQITAAARERFEKGQWQEMQADVLDRMMLYGKSLNRLRRLKSILGDQFQDLIMWERIRQEFLKMVHGRYNDDLALTTLYSSMRRIFSEGGIPVEYMDDGAARTSFVKAAAPYKEYSAEKISQELIRTILRNVPISLAFAKLEKQSGLISERLNETLKKSLGTVQIDGIDILEQVFYRNKGAYVVGRIRAGKRYVPVIFCLLNKRGMLDVHAVLTHETDVSNLFTYTRSNFHVNLNNQYRELVDFLETIMPSKGRAALYSAIGFIHPAKTELLKDFRDALQKSRGRLTIAKGTPGTTVTVFGRQGFPYLFKVPKEMADRGGFIGSDEVIAQYHRVHEMDRVGRILDAYHFYDLKLERRIFSDQVLEELKKSSPDEVVIDKDSVTLKHVYLQRKVKPLDVYLRTAGIKKAKQAIIEFGNCIRDLAAAGIWPGGFSLENFGVTAHGRVVLFDNSHVDSLLEHEFTQAPAGLTGEQGVSEPGGKVVYPELVGQFVPRNLRSVFRFAHSELYQYRYWQRVQEQLRKGEIPDFYPYPVDQVLEAGDAEVEKITEEPRFFSAGIKVDEVEMEGLSFARLRVPNSGAARVLVLEPIPPVMFAEFQEKFPLAQFDVLLPESELSRDRSGQWKSGIHGRLIELVKGGRYDYVIGYVNENFDADFFETAKLQGLVLLSTATHHVDLKAAAKNRTMVTNAPGPTTIPVAENLIAFALDSLYGSGVSEIKGPGKQRLTEIFSSDGNYPAVTQIMWYSLMRKVLRLDELFEFGASARYVRVGVSEGATVYHGKLGQHQADITKMSVGIVGLDEAGLRLAELAMAHEVARIYVLESELDDQTKERLQRMKSLVEAVSSTEGLSIELIPVSMDQLMSQSTFVLRTPRGYNKISHDPLTEVDIDAHELYISDPAVLTQSLQDLTVGIAGLGRIGEAAAQRFLALGANVLVYQRGHERAQYAEKAGRLREFANALGPVSGHDMGVAYAEKRSFLERSSMIAVSVSLSDETRGWIDHDALNSFGTRAEGNVRALLSITKDIIDENSLIPYLRVHPEVHVRMDVASNEQRGDVAGRFVDENGQPLTRVKVGGHTAASVWEMRREKVNLALVNLLALIQGETPANALNPPSGQDAGNADETGTEIGNRLDLSGNTRTSAEGSHQERLYDLRNGKSLTFTAPDGSVSFTLAEILEDLKEEETHHSINLLIAIPGGMEIFLQALRLVMETEPTASFQNFYFWTISYLSLDHPLSGVFYKALSEIDPARAGMMIVDLLRTGEDLDTINPSFAVHRGELERKLNGIKSFFNFSETDPALLKLSFEEKLKNRSFLRKPRVVYQKEGSRTYLKNEEIEFLAEIKGDTFENIGLIALRGLDDSHLSLEFPDDLIPYLENLLKDGVEIPFRKKLEEEIRRRKELTAAVPEVSLPALKRIYRNLETGTRHSERVTDWLLKGMMLDANSRADYIVSPFGEAIVVSHQGMEILLSPNVGTLGFTAALKEMVPSIGAWHARRVPYRVIGWVKAKKIYFSDAKERADIENYLSSLKPGELSYDLAYTRSAPLYSDSIYFELSAEGRGYIYEGHDQALENELNHVLSEHSGPVSVIDAGMGGGEFLKRIQTKYGGDSRVKLIGNEPSALMRKLAQIRLPGMKIHDYTAGVLSSADFGDDEEFKKSFKVAVLEGVATEGVMTPEQALAAFEELFKLDVDRIFATGNTPVNVDFEALIPLLDKYGYTLDRSLYPQNLFNLNLPKIMVVISKKKDEAGGNFSVTLDGSVADENGITNTEVSSQIEEVFTDTRNFEILDLKEVQAGRTSLGTALESFMNSVPYKNLDKEIKNAFESTRVVVFKDKACIAQNKKGTSYAHYGEARGSTLFIGQELLNYLLENDAGSLAVMIRIEMNRKIFRQRYGKDLRNSNAVITAAGISSRQIRILKKSIARTEAKNFVKKYGTLQTAEIIVRASEDLESLSGFAEIDDIDLGKIRSWIRDELSSELSAIMRSTDQPVSRMDRAVRKIQAQGELFGRQELMKNMLRHIENVGEDVDGVGLNIFTGEMRVYGRSGKIYEMDLPEKSASFLSQWSGKRAGGREWIAIDIRRNIEKEGLKSWLENAFAVLAGGDPVKESGLFGDRVFLEPVSLGETQVLHVSRGSVPVSAEFSDAENLISSIRYFESRSDKDRPIAIDSALLNAMSVEERISFVRKYQKRLAVLNGIKIDGISEEENRTLLANWLIYEKLPDDYRVVIVEKTENEEIQKIPKAALLPLTRSQIPYIEYAAVLASYIADIGKEAAGKDEKASDMLRQMIRALFDEGTLTERDLEGVNMREIIENPEKFLIPPVKTNHIDDLESYIRAERMVQSMA